MQYSWKEILLAHEYFYSSKISYEHVCRVWDISMSKLNSLDPERVYMPADFLDVINELTGGRIREILENNISNSKFNFLFLRNLDLDNIFPFSEMTGIQIIDCENNEIDSLVPLKFMKGLKQAYFRKNKISNLDPILQLDIEVLDLSENKIDYIAKIYQLKNLKKLDLHYNKITDISGAFCENLTHLNLYLNDITNIESLKNLYNLEELELGGNPGICSKDLVELCKNLPKCRIGIEYFNEDLVFHQDGYLKIYNDLVYFVSSYHHTMDHFFYIYIYLVEAENNKPSVDLSEDFHNILKELASTEELFHYTCRNEVEFIKEELNKCLNVRYNTLPSTLINVSYLNNV